MKLGKVKLFMCLAGMMLVGAEEIPMEPSASKREFDAKVKALVAKWDKNGNGKIDIEERRSFVRERALLAKERARKERKENAQKADKDGDGVLNPEERKALLLQRPEFERRPRPKAGQVSKEAK